MLLVAATVLGALLTASVASAAFAAFAYVLTPPEPVDWSTQPVEVRAGDPYDGCELTVDAVAPGTHEIRVFAVRPRVRVVVKDSSGRVILRAAEEADGNWTEVPTVRLGLGTYRVECRSDEGSTGSAELRVIPAGELGLE